MTIWQRFALFFLGFFGKIDDSGGNCILSLRGDFGHPPPVYIRNGEYLEPNGVNGTIVFQNSEKVLVGCPGNKNHVVIRYGNGTKIKQPEVVEASCASGHYFELDHKRVHFRNISCYSASAVSVQKTKEKCGKGGLTHIYKIGYEIDKFYSLYEACFDEALLTTYFVRHQISPMSKYIQTDSRPNFSEGGLFDTISMNSVYKQENQKARFDAMLGADEHKKYFHKAQFLSRGHLVPRGDFVMLSELRATFQYVNSAPQWISTNAGPWAAIEDSVRRRVAKLASVVRVVTGTHGVLTVPDQRGHNTPLYLNTDDNGNLLVPIPMYFYKVVEEPDKPTVAYVTVNAPFFNASTFESLRFCEDICEDIDWLHWKRRGRGSFCCDYDQFRRVVNYLPQSPF